MTPAFPAGAAFDYRNERLHCEQVALDALAARFGTPLYVYSRLAIETAFDAYASALGARRALVCYAMKANSNLAVLDLLARRGAGFDIVSGGELKRALAAGADPAKIVFSGVGKSEREMEDALIANILCFNVESAPELERLGQVASRCGRRARISVRVNPDVDAGTHPYIATGLKGNKFGVAYGDTVPLYRRARQMPSIDIVGIGCHIGSQITATAPYVDAAERLLDLVDALARDGIALDHIDFGGGLGITYRNEQPPPAAELITALIARVDARGHADKMVLVEPGRSIVGAAGVLVTRVEYLKPGAVKNFAIVDAAMNDLARPAMYDAWMPVATVVRPPPHAAGEMFDIVGPVCESGDWLARDRRLALAAGDLIAIGSAGAYGMTMSSNYNTRPRAAEVIVDGASFHCVRQRETVEQLYAGESRLP
jgi:diaminopimelate decarboxylase